MQFLGCPGSGDHAHAGAPQSSCGTLLTRRWSRRFVSVDSSRRHHLLLLVFVSQGADEGALMQKLKLCMAEAVSEIRARRELVKTGATCASQTFVYNKVSSVSHGVIERE